MPSCHSSSSSSSRLGTPGTSSLPLDLLRDVLSRLPTISLLKLRSICREWRDIIDDPHFTAVLTTAINPWHERWRLHRIGIGVDRLTNRYKIVRLSCLRNRAVPPLKAEVLNQGSRSWRDIASVPPSLLSGGSVFATRSIHRESVGECSLTRISSFDVAKEEFSWTPRPELQDAHLVDLQGVLGLVDSSRQERVDMWAMEDGGRWAKRYSIGLNSPWPVSSHWFLTVLGCGGRKIVFKYLESLLFYDLATDELEYVQRAGDLPAGRGCSSVIVMSLLSPAKLWSADKVLPWVA
ncbi:hypothetical protein ACJRO7_003672 [Eucalyptus globulus]|uniref:F-box domain-containing protein n=1 Tax=Eucalyptus globulus TaxID=34317 RepID=A0ABD3IX84_EUCGL